MSTWISFVLSIALLFSCKNEDAQTAQSVSIQIPDTAHIIELVPVSLENGTIFWIAKTELTWDIYDTFLQIVNSPENLYAEVDAITGPTPAYASVDRGFGPKSTVNRCICRGWASDGVDFSIKILGAIHNLQKSVVDVPS